MTIEQFEIGLRSKLMVQVNLVVFGIRHIRDHGSFTLTSGLTNKDPIRQGTSAAMVNGALDGFIRAAVIELRRGLRINLVSPTLVEGGPSHSTATISPKRKPCSQGTSRPATPEASEVRRPAVSIVWAGRET